MGSQKVCLEQAGLRHGKRRRERCRMSAHSAGAGRTRERAAPALRAGADHDPVQVAEDVENLDGIRNERNKAAGHRGTSGS